MLYIQFSTVSAFNMAAVVQYTVTTSSFGKMYSYLGKTFTQQHESLLVVNSSVIVSCSSPLSLVAAPMLTSPVAAISNRQSSSFPQMDLASCSSSGLENSTPKAGV